MSAQNTINNFIKESNTALQSKISKDKKNILFISYYSTYRKHYGELVSKLKDKYNVITIVDRILNDDFEKAGHFNMLFPWRVIENGETYYLNMEIEGIDLIITADQVGYEDGKIDKEFLSKSAKRVYLPHALFLKTGDSCLVDYICVSSKIAMSDYQKNKNTKCKFLATGYPKLDFAIKNYRYTDKNMITYAPNLRDTSADRNGNLNQIAGFDNNMIEWLLENTSYRVSYRAHPYNSLNNHINYHLIKQKWKNNHRVVFDESLGNAYNDYSDFMISDCTAGYTYSFSTLRPSFFFQPNYNIDFKQREMTEILSGGSLARSFKELKAQITNIDYKAIAEGIKDLRDREIYNVGHSEEVIIGYVDEILEGKL